MPAALLQMLVVLAVGACETAVPYRGICPCAIGYQCCNDRCVPRSQACQGSLADGSSQSEPDAVAGAKMDDAVSGGDGSGEAILNGTGGALASSPDSAPAGDAISGAEVDPDGVVVSTGGTGSGGSVDLGGGFGSEGSTGPGSDGSLDDSANPDDGSGSGGQPYSSGGSGAGGVAGSGGVSGSGGTSAVVTVSPSPQTVAAGAIHTCTIRAGGTVMCWGANDRGQLGDGAGAPDAVCRTTPVAVPGLTGVVSLSAGLAHTCALRTDATVVCWGDNYYGQVGNDGSSGQSTPTEVAGLPPVTAIRAGQSQTCAVTAGGSVKCWGYNASGQLGDGTTVTRRSPVTVAGLRDASDLSVGSNHACAVGGDGSVVCWGSNSCGQLGDGTFIDRLAAGAVLNIDRATAVGAGDQETCAVLAGGTVSCWGRGVRQLEDGTVTDSNTPAPVAGLTGVTRVSDSSFYRCALLGEGTVKCWGANWYGQIGIGSDSGSENTLVAVPGLAGVTSMVAGAGHACAVVEGGGVYCWGNNLWGQLGNPAVANRALPVTVPGLTGIVSLVAESVRTCALLTDGAVKCWGDDSPGLVTENTMGIRLAPTPVSGLPPGATALGIGESHACALLPGGKVACWGLNWVGELGSGELGDSSSTPVEVPGLTGVASLSVGRRHTCVLLVDGSAMCWGDNWFGQLGDGTAGAAAGKPTPVAVAGLGGIAALGAGDLHTCALLSDGTAKCWGGNGSGQLGDLTTAQHRTAPVAVSGLTDAVAISAGGSHTCALLKDRTMKCWGSNAAGKLGSGGTSDRSGPTLVQNLADITAIAAGGSHTCALLAGGTVKCWGQNNGGQVGDGSFGPSTYRATPVAVVGLAGVSMLTAGEYHTCALLTDGTARCWGSNDSGQIGDGTRTQSRTPLPVVF